MYEYWAIAIIVVITVFAIVLSIAYAKGVEISGSSVYRSLIYSVLRRPMHFFDTTTVGTIINRTVIDRENLDFQLGYFGQFMYFAVLQLMSILFLVGLSSGVMLLVFVVGLGIFFKRVGRLLMLVNEFRKLTQISLGPVTSNIVECVNGIASLQAFSNIPFQLSKFSQNAHKYQVAFYHEQFANFYVFWKGEMVAILLFFATTLSIAGIKVLDIKVLLNVQTISLALTAII